MMQRERREWVGSGLVLLALVSTALSCAKTEDPPNNGQSHWLEACRSDAECGELSCVCGLCTERCTSDAACGDAIEAQCIEPLQLSFASCEGDAPRGLCVPECDRNSDCSALTDELVCSDALCRPRDAMALDSGMSDSGTMDADSSVMMPDSSVMAPDSATDIPDAAMTPDGTFVSDAAFDPDASIGTLPVLVCAGAELDRSAAPSVEVIGVRGPNDPSWVLAAGGIVYRADPAEDDVLIYSASTAEPESFPVPQRSIKELRTGGGALFYGAADGSEVIVGRVDLNDASHLYLAREDQVNMSALVLVPGGLMFMADDARGSEGTTSLYRTTRDPGPAQLLAMQQGQVMYRSLAVLGSSAYYIVYGDGPGIGRRLYRVSAETSSEPEALGEPTRGLGELVTDGLSLFASLGEDFDSLGNPIEPQGVVRLSPVDGSLEMLHEMDFMDGGGLVVSGTELYFAGRRGDDRGVFRARTTGEPELVAALDARTFALAAGEGYLYVALFCEETEHVLRFPRP